MSGSGISWAICKSAPHSRQITTPAPHHSVFYRLDALPAAQPTASKHWKHVITTGFKQTNKAINCLKQNDNSGDKLEHTQHNRHSNSVNSNCWYILLRVSNHGDFFTLTTDFFISLKAELSVAFTSGIKLAFFVNGLCVVARPPPLVAVCCTGLLLWSIFTQHSTAAVRQTSSHTHLPTCNRQQVTLLFR